MMITCGNMHVLDRCGTAPLSKQSSHPNPLETARTPSGVDSRHYTIRALSLRVVLATALQAKLLIHVS